MVGVDHEVPGPKMLTLQLGMFEPKSQSPASTVAGPTTSGLMRPSRVGPNSVFHEITLSLRSGGRTPPTCSVFFASPGAASDIGGAGVGSTTVVVPQFPVSNKTSMSGCA